MTKKEKERMALRDWEEVNQCLRKMGELDIEKENLDGRLTLEINDVKQRYTAWAETVVSERRGIEALVKGFVEARKDEFIKVRSKDLDFGTIAWRVVSSIPTPRAVDKLSAVVRAVKALGMNCLLRVKEELDKEALERLSDMDLVKIGLARKVEDKLRIEPKMEAIKGNHP
jgi:phage host-nuclease inhibitor protein Gam